MSEPLAWVIFICMVLGLGFILGELGEIKEILKTAAAPKKGDTGK